MDLFILGSWFGLDRVRERLEATVLTQEDRYHVDVQGLGLSGRLLGDRERGRDLRRGLSGLSRPDSGPNFYAHAHNDYLELVLEYGVLGLACPVGWSSCPSVAALRVLYRRRDPLPRGMAFASLMGVMAILIHSTADFNLHIPANAALFVVLLALPWLGLREGTGSPDTAEGQIWTSPWAACCRPRHVGGRGCVGMRRRQASSMAMA